MYPDRFNAAPPAENVEFNRNHCGGFDPRPGVTGDGADYPPARITRDDDEESEQ